VRKEIEEWGKQHGLQLCIDESEGSYKVYFTNLHIVDGIQWRSTFGCGHTQESAMADYADKIRGKDLMAMFHDRPFLKISFPISI